jgi:hypothetical protein
MKLPSCSWPVRVDNSGGGRQGHWDNLSANVIDQDPWTIAFDWQNTFVRAKFFVDVEITTNNYNCK